MAEAEQEFEVSSRVIMDCAAIREKHPQVPANQGKHGKVAEVRYFGSFCSYHNLFSLSSQFTTAQVNFQRL